MSSGPAGEDARSRLVRDEATGCVGELMYIGNFEDPADPQRRPQRLAFLRPEGGGREWTTDPAYVTVPGRGLKGAL